MTKKLTAATKQKWIAVCQEQLRLLSVTHWDKVIASALDAPTFEAWWAAQPEPTIDRAKNALIAARERYLRQQREERERNLRQSDLPAFPVEDFYVRWSAQFGGEAAVDAMLGLPRAHWPVEAECDRILSELAKKRTLDIWFPRGKGMPVTLTISSVVVYKNREFTVTIAQESDFAKALALMDAFIAWQEVPHIDPKSLAADKESAPKNPDQGGGREKGPREEYIVTSITKLNGEKGGSVYRLGFLLKNGKEAEHPLSVNNQNRDVPALEAALKLSGYNPDKWPLGKTFSLDGKTSWVKGKEFAAGKFHHDDWQFAFAPRGDL